MAKPIVLEIKETIAALKKLQREHSPLIAKRLTVLIELKRHEKTGISKRDLSDLTGINHNTVLKWRKLYMDNGIAPFLVHGRVGFKKSIVTEKEHNALSKILHNATNGIVGYTALLEWVKKELNKDMQYITLVKYVQRHFGTKIKTARKSHIKKDEAKVSAFKKTLIKPAQR
jgi:transposase